MAISHWRGLTYVPTHMKILASFRVHILSPKTRSMSFNMTSRQGRGRRRRYDHVYFIRCTYLYTFRCQKIRYLAASLNKRGLPMAIQMIVHAPITGKQQQQTSWSECGISIASRAFFWLLAVMVLSGYSVTWSEVGNCKFSICFPMMLSWSIHRAKYGLAVIYELLQVFGKDLGLGYDIACSFAKTVRTSSLAAAAKELKLRLCVPSFHGFAHSRDCQLENHPLYITGFGLEDLEICEKVFAPANGCAKLSRHATRFHRHQSLHMQFTQWDEDKYTELCKFSQNILCLSRFWYIW